MGGGRVGGWGWNDLDKKEGREKVAAENLIPQIKREENGTEEDTRCSTESTVWNLDTHGKHFNETQLQLVSALPSSS